jgi:hypothetical protein
MDRLYLAFIYAGAALLIAAIAAIAPTMTNDPGWTPSIVPGSED